ncbi:hypothetical protein ABZP36_001703 [Zizania latifolia]
MAAAAVRPLALLFLPLIIFFSSYTASASDTILVNSSLADGQTLVSASEVFELGFFTPPTSTARFLGIWYKDISPATVVWVANREAPMSGTTGSLSVNGTGGGLVLADRSGRVFWSSAPSNGFIWFNGTSPVYRDGPWNGLQFSGEPDMEPNNTNFRFHFVDNRTDVYYSFAVHSGGVLSRFVLNQSIAQRYVWLPPAGWSLYWSMPRDQCDPYAHCGAYGVCDTSASPICSCAAGFSPVSPHNWELMDSSAGCARRTRLNCTGDGFLPLRGVKLPDTTNATMDATISVDQCRQRCQANCSCLAYSASNISGGDSGCIIWSSPLIDIKKFAYGGDDLYIRLAASDLPANGDDSRKKSAVLAVVLSLSVLLLLGLGGFFIWVKFFRKRVGLQSTQRLTLFDSWNHLAPVQDRTMEDETGHDKELNVTLFDINTIAFSTDNFAKSAKLGEGGFGTVYKGELGGGQTVAVKRLSKYSTQGLDEFKNEVMLIAKLQHPRLLHLRYHRLFISVRATVDPCLLQLNLLTTSVRFNRGMYSSDEQTSLLSYAWKLWREGNALSLLDEAVVPGCGEYRRSEMLRCVQVGLLCVQERPEDRPHMAAVFMMLGNLSAVAPQPRQPGFCSDRGGGSTSTDGERTSTCTVNGVTVTIVEGR